MLNKSEFDNVNLFQLRDIARELGVASPTSLKRDMLIEAICDIVTGKTLPSPKSLRGRPTKGTDEPSPLLKKLKSQMEFLQGHVVRQETAAPKQAYTARQEPPEFETPTAQSIPALAFERDADEREGVLEIHNEGFGFLRVRNCEPSSEDAYLSNAQIRRFNLRRGDTVRGKVKNIHEDKYDAMYNIISVNGIPLDK
ncbi:MAG: hypothetical protein WDA65_09555, partial [Christensenellales bacterium]